MRATRVSLYCFLSILLFSIFFRFISYPNRWGLGYDQAGFAIVARHAVETWQLPLLGPFSSGGPFQTGGLWYWAVATGSILFPNIVEGPWIFMGVLSLATIIALMITGYLLAGKRMAYVTGMLAAFSTAQITQSTNLSNQTPIALPASLALLASIAYIQTHRWVYLLFVGLGIGSASAIHLQGVGLLPIALCALLFGGRVSLKGVCALIIGLVLPWASVFIADATHSWYNITHMIGYYTVDQYTISLDVLGRRWTTFITTFLPHIWSFTIGGYTWIGILTITLSVIVGTYCALTKRIQSSWLFVACSFLGMVIVTRYARVPLFESFVVFFHSNILLLTAGCVVFFLKRKQFIGIALMLLILLGSTAKNMEHINHATNLTAKEAQRLAHAIGQLEKPVQLYDYRLTTAAKSFPLLLYLHRDNRLATDGYPIGISHPNPMFAHYPVLYTDETGIILYDLSSTTSQQRNEQEWALIDYPTIYNSVQRWYSAEKLSD
jgi:hypothetical protein